MANIFALNVVINIWTSISWKLIQSWSSLTLRSITSHRILMDSSISLFVFYELFSKLIVNFWSFCTCCCCLHSIWSCCANRIKLEETRYCLWFFKFSCCLSSCFWFRSKKVISLSCLLDISIKIFLWLNVFVLDYCLNVVDNLLRSLVVLYLQFASPHSNCCCTTPLRLWSVLKVISAHQVSNSSAFFVNFEELLHANHLSIVIRFKRCESLCQILI